MMLIPPICNDFKATAGVAASGGVDPSEIVLLVCQSGIEGDGPNVGGEPRLCVVDCVGGAHVEHADSPVNEILSKVGKFNNMPSRLYINPKPTRKFYPNGWPIVTYPSLEKKLLKDNVGNTSIAITSDGRYWGEEPMVCRSRADLAQRVKYLLDRLSLDKELNRTQFEKMSEHVLAILDECHPV